MAALADSLHPGVLKLIAMVVTAAHAGNKWVGVCGEMAARPSNLFRFSVGLGVDELSRQSPVYCVPNKSYASRISQILKPWRRKRWSRRKQMGSRPSHLFLNLNLFLLLDMRSCYRMASVPDDVWILRRTRHRPFCPVGQILSCATRCRRARPKTPSSSSKASVMPSVYNTRRSPDCGLQIDLFLVQVSLHSRRLDSQHGPDAAEDNLLFSADEQGIVVSRVDEGQRAA